MVNIVSFTLGPVQTNAYLLADPETGEAAVIDPGWDGQVILDSARQKGWRIGHIWFTHGHFDHIGGAGAIADAINPLPQIGLHPLDHDLWKIGGGAQLFGFKIDPGPEPGINLFDEQLLKLGSVQIKVLTCPGHTPGHCAFYISSANVLFSGDLIFQGSVGRTDLPGGDFNTLAESIQRKVFVLPDETRILSGHGPETSVGFEKKYNPFVGSR